MMTQAHGRFEEELTGILRAIGDLSGNDALGVGVLEATGSSMRAIDRLVLFNVTLPSMTNRWGADIHYRDGGKEHIADLGGAQALMLVLQAIYSQAKVEGSAPREGSLRKILRTVNRNEQVARQRA